MIYSRMVSLPVHLLPSPHSGSQLNGQQRSHAAEAAPPLRSPCSARAGGGCRGPCQPGLPHRPPRSQRPGARGLPAPPCCVPAPLREMVLLVLVSDVNPYKSPDQRRRARAAWIWHGTFSSFLCIFKVEAIMCFSLGFFYTETTLSCRDGARKAPLWSLWSRGEEGGGKHSSLSRLCLWISPGRELAPGTCCPWGTTGLTEEQRKPC